MVYFRLGLASYTRPFGAVCIPKQNQVVREQSSKWTVGIEYDETIFPDESKQPKGPNK